MPANNECFFKQNIRRTQSAPAQLVSQRQLSEEDNQGHGNKQTILILGHGHSDVKFRLSLPEALKVFADNDWLFCYEKIDPVSQQEIDNSVNEIEKMKTYLSECTGLSIEEVNKIADTPERIDDIDILNKIEPQMKELAISRFHQFRCRILHRDVLLIGNGMGLQPISIDSKEKVDKMKLVQTTIRNLNNEYESTEMDDNTYEKQLNSYIQRRNTIARERDEFMAQQIKSLCQENKNILVLVGCAHAVNLKSILETQFDSNCLDPIYATINKESFPHKISAHIA